MAEAEIREMLEKLANDNKALVQEMKDMKEKDAARGAAEAKLKEEIERLKEASAGAAGGDPTATAQARGPSITEIAAAIALALGAGGDPTPRAREAPQAGGDSLFEAPRTNATPGAGGDSRDVVREIQVKDLKGAEEFAGTDVAWRDWHIVTRNYFRVLFGGNFMKTIDKAEFLGEDEFKTLNQELGTGDQVRCSGLYSLLLHC